MGFLADEHVVLCVEGNAEGLADFACTSRGALSKGAAASDEFNFRSSRRARGRAASWAGGVNANS
jgi:hypothetical protein